MVFPSQAYGEGTFDAERPYTMYDCTGDKTENSPMPEADRVLSPNAMALGECLGKAAALGRLDLWAFTLVLKGGAQHVYVGTPAEAANGSGSHRIEGVMSAAIWVGKVGRKPHKAKRKVVVAPTAETFYDLADSIEQCCFTQGPSSATRSDATSLLGELHVLVEELGVKVKSHSNVRIGKYSKK